MARQTLRDRAEMNRRSVKLQHDLEALEKAALRMCDIPSLAAIKRWTASAHQHRLNFPAMMDNAHRGLGHDCNCPQCGGLSVV